MNHPAHVDAKPDFDAQFRAKLFDLFRWRRDVRHFRPQRLPEGTLVRLIHAACLAPSVGLSEPWRFVIVEDRSRRQAVIANFREANAQALRAQDDDRTAAYARLKLSGLVEAPGHVAVFADRETSQGHGLGRHTMPETIEYSVVMAIHTLWLAARAEGIGVGWVSILDAKGMGAILEIPVDWTFIGYLCVGYAAENDVTPKLERDGWESRRAPSITMR